MVNNDIHYIRKEVDNLQAKMSEFTVRTEYAQNQSDTNPPTTGWSEIRPSSAEGYFIWVRNIMNMGYGDVISEPYCVGDGLEHITGLDVEYISWADPYEKPPHSADGWQTTAPSLTWGHYIWSRTKIITTEQVTYTDPVRITGDASEEIAIGNGYPSDGKYVHIVYSDVNNPTDWNQCFRYPANHRYVGVLVNTSEDYVTTPSSYSWSEYKPTKGYSVGNGKYFHIKYSNNPNGVDANNNTDMNDKGGLFLGYCTDTSLNDPTTPNSYTWIRLEGKGILEIIEHYAESTHYDIAPTTGWSTTPPTFRAGYFYWTKSIIYYTDSTTYETTPICVSGVDGTGVHYVYFCKNVMTAPSTPSWSDIHTNSSTMSNNYRKWVEDPVPVTEDNPYIYISSSTDYNAVTGEWVNFSEPALWSKLGADGKDGEGFEIVFYLASTIINWNTASNNPHKLSPAVVSSDAFQTADYVPWETDEDVSKRWYDDAQGVNSSYPYEYASTRTKNENGVWSAFSQPFVWSKYGNDGKDGEGFEIVFYQSNDIIDWEDNTNNYRNPKKLSSNIINSNDFQTADYIPFAGQNYAWSDDAQGVSVSMLYEYASTRTKDENGIWSAFSTPFMWSKFGNDGIDGDGYHYIFYRTTTNTVPSTPVYGITPIIDNKTTPEAEITANSWYEESIGASPDYPYEWTSVRVFDGENQLWGDFSTPTIWNDYTVDGKKGNTGGDGVRGADGDLMTGDELVDKINLKKSDEDPLGFTTSTNYVPSILTQQTITSGTAVSSGEIIISRQGDLCIIAVNNLYINKNHSNINLDDWTICANLPSWAIPPHTFYFDNIVSPNADRMSVDANAGQGRFRFWLTTASKNANSSIQNINFSGTVTYPVATSVINNTYVPQFSLPSQTGLSSCANATDGCVKQGTTLKIKCYYQQNQHSHIGTVFAKFNGKLTKHETDNNGCIYVKIDADAGNKDLTVWTDGYDYTDGYPSELHDTAFGRTNKTFHIYVVPSLNTSNVTFHQGNDYYIKVYDDNNNLFRYKDITIDINGIKYNAQTDSKGEYHYNLSGYKGAVTVTVEVTYDSRNANNDTYENTFTNTYNLESTNPILKLYPSRITGTNWTNLNSENLRNKNDGNYVCTNTIPPNGSTNECTLYFDNVDIPLVGTVENVSLNINYGSLYGSTHLSRPILSCDDKIWVLGENNDFLCSFDFKVDINQRNCGMWKLFSDSEALDKGNDDGVLNNLEVIIPSVDFDSDGDSGVFAIDFVELEIEYSIS